MSSLEATGHPQLDSRQGSRNREPPGLLLVVAAAFALRVYRLGYQSLWGDEAYSVWRASKDFIALTQEAHVEGTLPPLYYWLLHFWMPLAGQSEFAVRYLSLLFGVLTVPVAYCFVRRIFDPLTGLYAALVFAAAPFLVYYSQEARMYAQVTFFVLLSSCLLVRLTDRGDAPTGRARRTLWVAYALANVAALLSHYFGGFVVLAQALYFGVFWWRHRVDGREWVASQLAAGLLLAPWVIYIWSALQRTGDLVSRFGIGLDTIADRVLRAFSLGMSVAPKDAPTLLFGFVVLALIGLASLRTLKGAFLGLYVVVPVLVTYVISFAPQVDWPRYFIMASPGFYALLARGMSVLHKGLPVLGLIGFLTVAVPSLVSLNNYYFDPRYARFDFRGQMAEVEAPNGKQEAIIVNDLRQEAFSYYYKGLKPYSKVPREGVEGRPEIEAELARLAAGNEALWLVKYMPPDYDPDNAIERWLAFNAYKVNDNWVQNIHFHYYLAPKLDLTRGGPNYRPFEASFDDNVTLLGSAFTGAVLHPGDTLGVALYWQVRGRVPQDYKVFIHVLDAREDKIAQSDSQPVVDFSPTTSWKAGDVIEDKRGLRLSKDAKPGEYRVLVGLYSGATGARLRITPSDGSPGADSVVAGTIMVEP